MFFQLLKLTIITKVANINKSTVEVTQRANNQVNLEDPYRHQPRLHSQDIMHSDRHLSQRCLDRHPGESGFSLPSPFYKTKTRQLMLAVAVDAMPSKMVECSRVHAAPSFSIKMVQSTLVSRAIRLSQWTTWSLLEAQSLLDCMINWMQQLTHRLRQTSNSFSLMEEGQLFRHLKRPRATQLWSRTKIAKLAVAKLTLKSILTTMTCYFKKMI